MAIARIDRLDDSIGAGVEQLVVAHHRRRLKRRGWQHAYDPPSDGLWCAADPPPRDGNKAEVLVSRNASLGGSKAYLPHVSRRTRRFLGPINGLLVDG
jgi:hypothetical protein